MSSTAVPVRGPAGQTTTFVMMPAGNTSSGVASRCATPCWWA